MKDLAGVSDWGVSPVLFSFGGWSIPAYSFFMVLGLAVGLFLFWREVRLHGALSERTFYLLLAALFGGAIGSKIPVAILDWNQIVARLPDPTFLFSGRSVTGALVGGATGIFLMKKKLKITARFGNLFVPAIAGGVAVGRLGCFLRGCCYGTPTNLPWGVDFGDGVLRHPTQLYETMFMVVVLCLAYAAIRRLPEPPGMVFKCFMIAFFFFRFLEEFVRQEDAYWLGLTLFQWISLGVVLFYAVDLARLTLKERKVVA